MHVYIMNVQIEIREYKSTDKPSLMHLLDLNIPRYFAVEESADFSHYLDHERELYYVLLLDNQIVGCGGVNFAGQRTVGRISWDILHPDYQGKSLGARLLQYRLEILRSIDSILRITVRTSQLAYRFYEKQGFQLKEIKKDYWAKGFDMYDMEYTEN